MENSETVVVAAAAGETATLPTQMHPTMLSCCNHYKLVVYANAD